MSKRRSVRPGDVYELAVDRGYAHVQAIAKHPDFGWAMRVFSPIPESAGTDAKRVSEGDELFVTLMGNVALEAAEGRLRFVGSVDLPGAYDDGSLPVFRANAVTDAEGRHQDGSWWLDDGTKEWRVGSLTEEQQRLPYRQLVPALALRVLIDAGWDPRWEFKGPGAREYRKPPRWNVEPEATSSFHLLFPRAEDARSAAEAIAADGRVDGISVFAPSDEQSPLYSVVAELGSIGVDELAQLDDYFEGIAKRFSGEYDGNEVPIVLDSSSPQP